jgi:hypothetical protein
MLCAKYRHLLSNGLTVFSPGCLSGALAPPPPGRPEWVMMMMIERKGDPALGHVEVNQFRPLNCIDLAAASYLFILNLGTVFKECLNLGTIFHKRSKQLLIKYACIILHNKCLIRHKRNTHSCHMALSHLIHTACRTLTKMWGPIWVYLPVQLRGLRRGPKP